MHKSLLDFMIHLLCLIHRLRSHVKHFEIVLLIFGGLHILDRLAKNCSALPFYLCNV